MGIEDMHLTATEVDQLEATFGQTIARVFCPQASIFPFHIEAYSYIVWLNNMSDFVSIYVEELTDNSGRIRVARGDQPIGVIYDPDPLTGGVRGCSEIWLNPWPTLAGASVFADAHQDVAIALSSAEESSFTILLEYPDLCFYRGVPEQLSGLTPRLILGKAIPNPSFNTGAAR
ncbi:MAG: hypothetical protein IPL72_16855 [Sulfuritalea sp.]|nr:hypothetical protein [Sulfuritalea sp.]